MSFISRVTKSVESPLSPSLLAVRGREREGGGGEKERGREGKV